MLFLLVIDKSLTKPNYYCLRAELARPRRGVEGAVSVLVALEEEASVLAKVEHLWLSSQPTCSIEA